MNDEEISKKIRQCFLDILERDPNPVTIENYSKRIKNEEITLEQLPLIFKKSPEYLKKHIVKKPIFFVGPGRSGTTVLYNMFTAHRDLCWFTVKQNEKIFSKVFLKMEKIRQKQNRDKGILQGGELALLFFGDEYIKKNTAWNMIKKAEEIPIEGVHIFGSFFGKDFAAKLTKRSEGIKDLIATSCVEKNVNRFINKNPENLKRVDALNSLFPDALFVCILRNPFAIVNSMIQRVRKEGKSYYTGMPTLNVDNEKTNDIEYASLNLNQNLELTFEFSQKVKDRFYFIFYEDLIKDTKNEIKKLLKFLELHPYSDFINNLQQLGDMNKKWKEKLTKEEVEIISNTLSETMKKFNLPYNLKKESIT